jgi:hypothetical protein
MQPRTQQPAVVGEMRLALRSEAGVFALVAPQVQAQIEWRACSGQFIAPDEVVQTPAARAGQSELRLVLPRSAGDGEGGVHRTGCAGRRSG